MAVTLKDYTKIAPGVYKHKADAKAKIPKQRWLINTRINGKPTRKVFTLSIDTPTNMEQQAVAKLVAFRAERSKLLPESGSVDFYFTKWEKSKGSWCDAHRKSMKLYYKNHIKSTIGSKPIRDVTTMNITDILSIDATLRTKKNITEILFPLFRYALDNNLILESPVKSSHKIVRNSIKEKRKVTGAPTKYKKVYKAILGLDPEEKALMLFGFHGRRKNEVLNLKWEDIFKDTYIVRKEFNKVGEDMVYTLPSDLVQVLEELKEERNGTGYIFESPKDSTKRMTDIRKPVAKIRERSGIKEFGYHWMRNLAVTALSQKKVSTVDLSAMLGHTDLNTLRKYLSFEREESTQRTTAAAMDFLKDK